MEQLENSFRKNILDYILTCEQQLINGIFLTIMILLNKNKKAKLVVDHYLLLGFMEQQVQVKPVQLVLVYVNGLNSTDQKNKKYLQHQHLDGLMVLM